jgi:hypothetical protein
MKMRTEPRNMEPLEWNKENLMRIKDDIEYDPRFKQLGIKVSTNLTYSRLFFDILDSETTDVQDRVDSLKGIANEYGLIIQGRRRRKYPTDIYCQKTRYLDSPTKLCGKNWIFNQQSNFNETCGLCFAKEPLVEKGSVELTPDLFEKINAHLSSLDVSRRCKIEHEADKYCEEQKEKVSDKCRSQLDESPMSSIIRYGMPHYGLLNGTHLRLPTADEWEEVFDWTKLNGVKLREEMMSACEIVYRDSDKDFYAVVNASSGTPVIKYVSGTVDENILGGRDLVFRDVIEK